MSLVVLDAFCGQGGAGYGYSLAGYRVVGVDIAPQPRYPFEFVQDDALEHIARYGHLFDAIHASPPCQAYSQLRHCRPGRAWWDSVPPTREVLRRAGPPWILESVAGPHMSPRIMLCGQMFGLRVIRHRVFESPVRLSQPFHIPHGEIEPYGSHGENYPRAESRFRTALECPWMTARGARQALPPAYTRYIGQQLQESL